MGRIPEELACDEIINFDKRMKRIFEENPLRRALTGKYGELRVAADLKRRGFTVEQVEGNLTPYDLVVNGHKLEVRTSEVKHERAFPKNVSAWGWRLQSRGRDGTPKEIKWEYIILVQLLDSWKRYRIHLLSKGQVEEVSETHFAGYQTVARVIYLFLSRKDFKEAREHDKNNMITKACIEFNANPLKYKIDWNELKKLLS